MSKLNVNRIETRDGSIGLNVSEIKQVGFFSAGITVSSPIHEVIDSEGNSWRYTATLPVTVPAGYNPVSKPNWILGSAGSSGSGGTGITIVSETQPSTQFQRQGVRWFNPTTPATYTFYEDGTSGQWLEEGTASPDGRLREDLASENSSVLLAGVEARRLNDYVNGIKNLKQSAYKVQTVKGFYANTNFGGGTFIYDPSRPKADHDGGVVIAPEAIAAWNGSVENIGNLLSWTSSSGSGCYVRTNVDKLDLFMFGGYDLSLGKRDNKLQLITMFSVAKKLQLKTVASGKFYVSDEVSHLGFADFDGVNAEFEFRQKGFNFTNTHDTPVNIVSFSNSYLSFADDPEIEVAGFRGCKVSMPNAVHGFNKNDVVKMIGAQQYSWSQFTSKVGQFAHVVRINGNEIWLDRELEEVAYTQIVKLHKTGLNIKLRCMNTDDSGEPGALLTTRNYVYPEIHLTVPTSMYQAHTLAGCYGGKVTLIASDIRNYNADQSKWGYGIVDRGSEAMDIYIQCKQIRHGYTTTHGGDGNELERFGQARYQTISGVGVNCITPFDVHESGEYIKFINATAINSYGSGFSVRAKDTTLVNCHTTGGSDSGFFVFDNTPATVTVARGGITRLKACTSKGHRRGLRVSSTGQNLAAKDADNRRIFVDLDSVEFDCVPYTDAIYTRNAKLTGRNVVIRYNYSEGSVYPEIAAINKPVFQRGFFKNINSNYELDNVRLEVTTSATRVYPFIIKTDRTNNTGAITAINVNGLSLVNDAFVGFNQFGEVVATEALDGQVGPVFDYTSGLAYSYIVVNDLSLQAKQIAQLMRKEVAQYYESSSDGRTAGCVFTISKALTFNPTMRATGDVSTFSIGSPATGFEDSKHSIVLNNVYSQRLAIRCVPSTGANPGLAVIDINELTASAGRFAIGMMLDIVNAGTDGTNHIVKVSATNVVPTIDSIPVGKVYSLIFDGVIWKQAVSV